MSKVTDSADIEALRAQVVRLTGEVERLTLRAEQAEALAAHDSLTGILNRRGFIDQVVRTMAYSRRHQVAAVLIYLDMDGFKQINDQLGHAAGDAALICVAQVLMANVRGSDAVGRIGGDEFALVLLNAGFEQGLAKAEQMQAHLDRAGFAFEGQAARLGGSFGVRMLDDQKDAEQWLAEADAAMWENKRRRRG